MGSTVTGTALPSIGHVATRRAISYPSSRHDVAWYSSHATRVALASSDFHPYRGLTGRWARRATFVRSVSEPTITAMHPNEPRSALLADQLRMLAARIESVDDPDTEDAGRRLAALGSLSLAMAVEVDAVEAGAAARADPDAARRRAILKLVDDHGADSRNAQRVTYWLYGATGLVLVASVGSAMAGLAALTPAGRYWSPHFTGSLILSGLLVLAAILLWVQAERHRRSAAESRRLQRQFAALDLYLEPMPEPIRAVMRAALAPRLFSRLLEDNDPMREPIWPSPEKLYSDSFAADSTAGSEASNAEGGPVR